MHRAAGAVAVGLAVLACALPATASAGASYGIQDDAWLSGGPGTLESRISTLKTLGARVVRFTLRWDAVAPSKPADARDPEDPAYDWGVYGDVLDALHARGLTALVTIYGSPRWANGGGRPNVLPATGMREFAYAAALRFPWVHLWTAWNEPNTRIFSLPVSPAKYVRTVLNPAYAGLHEASGANKLAGGVTSPRKTPTGMAPLDYMKGMHAAHARLDAYAHNPYAVAFGETPYGKTCVSCLTMAELAQVRREVTRYFGRKPLWLTEYGYQTNPPDRLLGVSYARQAAYLGQAGMKAWYQPGVTMLIQFLVRDEPALGGWQSGLLDIRSRRKPAFRAFALPLAERSRHGARVTLWGMVRPGSGKRPYRLQRSVGGRWRAVGGVRRTARSGVLVLSVALPRGAKVRLLAPGVGASPALLVP